jgi:PhnB protein
VVAERYRRWELHDSTPLLPPFVRTTKDKITCLERNIPAMKLTTYVNFPGTCAQALDFYVQQLGATIQMKGTFGEMASRGGPQAPPPGLKPESIIHARIQIGDTVVMASDGPPEHVQPMRSAYLTLSVNSNEEAEHIYAALTAGGTIFMPLEETFFAQRFAMFRDQFGVNWMLIHEKAAPGRG